jgi:D-lactate dehydrogenase
MKALVFSAHDYDRDALTRANSECGHVLTYLEMRLDATTAPLAAGFEAVVVFVNDRLDATTLRTLAAGGVRLVALRCAGLSYLDFAEAKRLGLVVVNVPVLLYAPHAVAEHVFALLLSLARHIPRAYTRVRDRDFSLDGLVGMDVRGKTFGIVGLGRIGHVVATIAQGFGCKVIGYDPLAVEAAGRTDNGRVEMVPLGMLMKRADIISLHAPLTSKTRHMIGTNELLAMKPHAILINTSRGALVDSKALVSALKQGKLGGVGLDVYEQEEGVFYNDRSDDVLADDVLARLLTFPNVIVTSHMGFLTRDALAVMADTTIANLGAFAQGTPQNELRSQR